jgi:prephenate dehydrogenase (NADP+)
LPINFLFSICVSNDEVDKGKILGSKRAAKIGMAVTPARTSDMECFVVGLIGMGDMGKMYARRLSPAGWR